MGRDAFACFTFDNMGEAADVGAGLRDGPAPEPDRSLTEGYPRLLDLLDRHGIRATFFVEGWNGVHHPDAVAELARRGHEVGMHGWTHERWDTLEPEAELALAARATEALADAAGTRPTGFRAPGGSRSAATESILSQLGYAYDASLGDGMRAARLPSGLAQVPFVWPCVDGFHYLRPEPAEPAAVRAQWLQALERVAEHGGLFLLICHAFISGVEEARLRVLRDVIRAADSDPRVEIRTAGEIADSLLGEPS